MGYNKPNPLKMMESALKMYKAEKKGGMHRMESPMYAKEASRELKDMPIVDIEKGDAKGSPAKGVGGMTNHRNFEPEGTWEKHKAAKHGGSPAKAAKPDFLDLDKDGNTSESMKDAAKAKGSPAKMGHKKDSPAKAYSKGASGHGYTAGQYAAHQDQSIVKQNPKHVAAHSGSPAKKQGYNDRLDESLAKDGKESSKKQSMKDRRDESKGMEKSKGKGAYSSDPKMS